MVDYLRKIQSDKLDFVSCKLVAQAEQAEF